MQTVLLTPSFERQAARAGLSEDEVLEIAAWIGHNPFPVRLWWAQVALERSGLLAVVRARVEAIGPFTTMAETMFPCSFSASSAKGNRGTYQALNETTSPNSFRFSRTLTGPA
jgi:hypothetical protein